MSKLAAWSPERRSSPSFCSVPPATFRCRGTRRLAGTLGRVRTFAQKLSTRYPPSPRRVVHRADPRRCRRDPHTTNNYEEGLGRIVCAAGAWNLSGLPSGLCYNILTVHPTWSDTQSTRTRGVCHKVLPPPRRFLHLLSSEVSPRVDAQASKERPGRGGRYPVLVENGTPDTRRSPWHSLEITRHSSPWVFEKRDTTIRRCTTNPRKAR